MLARVEGPGIDADQNTMFWLNGPSSRFLYHNHIFCSVQYCELQPHAVMMTRLISYDDMNLTEDIPNITTSRDQTVEEYLFGLSLVYHSVRNSTS